MDAVRMLYSHTVSHRQLHSTTCCLILMQDNALSLKRARPRATKRQGRLEKPFVLGGGGLGTKTQSS